jgi:hypothetical protein
VELCVFDCNIRVDCIDQQTQSLIVANYGWFRGQGKKPDLRYLISRGKTFPGFVIARDGMEPVIASDEAEFLFLFEKDLTIELQKLRHDLYFLHGAALEYEKRAIALIAPSGFGKSTTTWGLLHHGFRYLSDELTPVNLKTLEVVPYPHSLSLKNAPPMAYPLPNSTIYTSSTRHIPAESLPGGVTANSTQLSTIFFLQYTPGIRETQIVPVSKAEAAIRIFSNALNPLAHQGDGLDGAIEIALKSQCLDLFATHNASQVSELVKKHLATYSRQQLK